MSEVDKEKPMVGVWWDINTCPVPYDIDPRSVRLRIESEMKKRIHTPFRVVVFCVGNLDYIPLEILQNLSDSGIVLVHATRGFQDIRNFVDRWSKLTPLSETLLLISSNYTWHHPITTDEWKYTVVLYASGKGDLVWEALLKNNPVDDKTISSNMLNGAISFCEACDDISQNCQEFIEHLKSDDHREEMFLLSWRTDDDGKRVHYCKVCNYPGYDEGNMDIHYNSDEHKKNLFENEAQKEDCKSRKRSLGEDLLKEANKKR